MAEFDIAGGVLASWFQGSTIQVDTSVMVNKANQVSHAISRMERTFSQLQQIVSGTNGYWIGDAAEHHRKMFYDEKEDIIKILNRLKEHPQDLKQMAAGYEKTEKTLAGENQQLRNDYI
ncbi:MAG: WXG100 family type VII secretion target [Lachnospiraceae bacterium]|nr:WXG100 family type VII secretion target [Lachnospiraceae bacterium]